MNTHQSILSELNKLEKMPHVDKKILKHFFLRLKNPKILRSENSPDHFCVFFVPFDPKTKSVYIGHHIKANDWIPPGGHIEDSEHPLDTIKREMLEELSFKLTNETVELFDITVKPINRTDCQKHWDLWYLIYMNKTDFIFDKGEFYKAIWLSFQEAKKIMKLKDYNQTVQKLASQNFARPRLAKLNFPLLQKMSHQRLSNDK